MLLATLPPQKAPGRKITWRPFLLSILAAYGQPSTTHGPQALLEEVLERINQYDLLILDQMERFSLHCSTPTCPRKIFTERLPGLVQPYGRMTTRLSALLQVLGLGTGGQLGTRLAERQGIVTSPSSLLRSLMQFRASGIPAVRVLGVDDWSWKKRRRYGTILVDLERHKIIDLLQDRERSTFAAWLRAHPTVRVISRDRATDYAAAAREAAPQALQVADRYHLVHNLADALELFLARCRTEIRRASQERLPEDVPRTLASPVSVPPSAHVWRQQPTEDELNAPTMLIGRSGRIAIGSSALCTRKG